MNSLWAAMGIQDIRILLVEALREVNASMFDLVDVWGEGRMILNMNIVSIKPFECIMCGMNTQSVLQEDRSPTWLVIS